MDLAAEGDARAFERLYRENVARVHGLARRMAGPDAADDLTQEVFVKAWNALDSFRGDAAFSTWLHRVAVNVILTEQRSRKRSEARVTIDEDEVGRAWVRPAPTGTRIDFEDALAGLPDGARRVFVLHDVEGYRHHEIAEMLGVTAGTSKSQLHRARMLLRESLTA